MNRREASDEGLSTEGIYDTFSDDYDRFVDWGSRLATELPFLEHQLRSVEARKVLDVACGTGMHAIALAERGYEMVGIDSSESMVHRARTNAVEAGQRVVFEAAGFCEASTVLRARGLDGPFDAVLCLGNSLPHLLTHADLSLALTNFATCLRARGLLLIQNRNFDSVLSHRRRWMNPQSHLEGDQEWLFVRFYDFEPDGLLTFNLMTLNRDNMGPWQQSTASTRLRPITQEEMIRLLKTTQFGETRLCGDMRGADFDPARSPNLVAISRLVS